MKKFEYPEITVEELVVEDVLTTSGGDDWSVGEEEM